MDGETDGFSRRDMVVGLAGTAALVGAVGVSALPTGWLESRRALVRASWWDRRTWTLETAGVREWSSRVGNLFVLFNGGREIAARLVKVEAFPSKGERPPEVARDQAFAAYFDVGRHGLPSGDRIYHVAHVQYGDMRVFLAACGDETCPNRAIAVFN
jgi:hypothetical protein